MKSKLSVGLVSALLLFATGCGDSPQDRWIEHLEDVVSILEANQEAPAQAAEEIRKYTELHSAELQTVRAAMKEKRESLSPEAREEYAKKLVERLAPVMQRYMKLIAKPALAGSQEILDAMAPYGP